jgi:hypothetical protein
MIRPLLLLTAAASLLSAFDLDAIRKEPNLEKRSELALGNAEAALDRARDAYQKGEDAGFKAALAEVSDSIELCKQSLDESGKNARKSPKYFKKAEIGIRKLSRRLDNLQVEVSVDDRPTVEPVVGRAHKLQEEILLAIMGKKK